MPYIHFKMDTIEKFLRLIKKDMYMSKIDLKDAYYSVKINDEHQKFLKFYFNSILYKFTCLPNGLCSGPRVFTKLLKPPLANLRAERLMLISAYIDDLITAHKTFQGCFDNVLNVI
uniref:Reverse transcriptase domain-containing protein n=1 Tax=Clytia hemisphaerica TaxID=252671 RepID=A0A7M5XJK9_9CNID